LTDFRVTAIEALAKDIAGKIFADHVRRVAPHHQYPVPDLDVEGRPLPRGVELSEHWQIVFSTARKRVSAGMKDFYDFRTGHPDYSIPLAEQEFHISNDNAKQRTKRIDDDIRAAHREIIWHLVRNIGEDGPSVTFECRLRSQEALKALVTGPVQNVDFRIFRIASFMGLMVREIGHTSENYERAHREARDILYFGPQAQDPSQLFILTQLMLLFDEITSHYSLGHHNIESLSRDYDAICYLMASKFRCPIIKPIGPFDFADFPADSRRMFVRRIAEMMEDFNSYQQEVIKEYPIRKQRQYEFEYDMLFDEYDEILDDMYPSAGVLGQPEEGDKQRREQQGKERLEQLLQKYYQWKSRGRLLGLTPHFPPDRDLERFLRESKDRTPE
jgi:hypothetical protein